MNPQSQNDERFRFALGFGVCPSSDAEFKVVISPYQPEGKDAHLILPGPNFLEIEGHVLGDNAKISRFVNPSKSTVFAELTRLFYSLGWISPATADIPYWNNLAQELITSLKKHKRQSFTSVDPSTLRTLIQASDAPMESHMARLFKLRKSAVKF
jgi:hypothetical protein